MNPAANPLTNALSALSFEDSLSATMLRLRRRSPYFSTLALYTNMVADKRVPIASTDGVRIYINPEKWMNYTNDQRDCILLHEVLHAALLHVTRRHERDPKIWNIAADVVVNGMIVQEKIALLAGSIRQPDLENLPVEEIYELLLKNGGKDKNGKDIGLGDDQADLDENAPWCPSVDDLARYAHDLQAHWRLAHEQARIATSTTQGSMPAGFDREMSQVSAPELDWRTMLWRYLARTPTDFLDFDRRFIGQRMYLDTLDGYSVKAFIAVDTSGSIGGEELSSFLSEVRGITRAYPHVKALLYYIDADLYGPYPIDDSTPMPKPKGGGGTDFRPFFVGIDQLIDDHDIAVCVYLTDGYGTFPDKAPRIDTLWVVSPGGLDPKSFPFGETTRLMGAAAKRK